MSRAEDLRNLRVRLSLLELHDTVRVPDLVDQHVVLLYGVVDLQLEVQLRVQSLFHLEYRQIQVLIIFLHFEQLFEARRVFTGF